MSDFVDYYEILQVVPMAEPEVIGKAYKALIFKYHPDRGGDEETAKRITGAYYVLSDSARRAEYDLERDERVAQGVVSNPVAPHSVRLEEIPPDVIDAILARYWMDGAAATVRTAGRVAGAATIAGAGVVANAAAKGARAIADSEAAATAANVGSNFATNMVMGGAGCVVIGIIGVVIGLVVVLSMLSGN